MAQLGVPLRIRSSSSSTSSLSSTFSDLASTSTASSSPPHSKTSAFFASPFSTRPPSPAPAPMHPLRSDKPRSLTADFFATSVRPPSPPASARGPSASISSIPPSSIFPSRYTSSLANPDRTRDFTILSADDAAPHAYHPLPAHHSRTSSAGSDDLPTFSSPTSPTFGVPRLPTPPPPKHHRAVAREDTIMPARDAEMHDEPTPRPAPREPALLKFERSLLLARQTETVEAEEVAEEEEEEVEQEELKEGSIISLPPSIAHGLSPPARAVPLPMSPLALAFTLGPVDPVMNDRGTPTPTPSSGVYSFRVPLFS
ncbi:hypothetical protein HYPSUDRAFT_68077 [Hypholoma sublateritium FD-334 SS-4]|uniref:Uncharacterized protein n=1 Tax=Hypholoma sublateritium (strain FD-334 SS-4) TaxID=945553 RepID=A0A0D2MCG7_HYPSF|nr:hypothetical protein HYPSUDRAFT_68077 [Hypholoma sublateritium FD-334 SS-4]